MTAVYLASPLGFFHEMGVAEKESKSTSDEGPSLTYGTARQTRNRHEQGKELAFVHLFSPIFISQQTRTGCHQFGSTSPNG